MSPLPPPRPPSPFSKFEKLVLFSFLINWMIECPKKHQKFFHLYHVNVHDIWYKKWLFSKGYVVSFVSLCLVDCWVSMVLYELKLDRLFLGFSRCARIRLEGLLLSLCWVIVWYISCGVVIVIVLIYLCAINNDHVQVKK